MCCSAASLQLSVHFKYQSDLYIAQCGCTVSVFCYLKVVVFIQRSIELQVRMKFGVVTEVSTFWS